MPIPLHLDLALATCPQDVGETPFHRFAAVAIHKGDLPSFPPEFLYHALTGYDPVFANDVFLVVAAPNPDKPAPPRLAHAGGIAEMCAWALAQAPVDRPFQAQPRLYRFSRDETALRMARLVAEDLVKPIAGFGAVAPAETARPFENSDWFWGDDAAKLVELFCLPAVRRRWPDLSTKLVGVVQAMATDSVMHRRLGREAARIEHHDAATLRLHTPFVTSEADQATGRIAQAIRFNDGRSRPLAVFAPGVLQLRWRGRTVQQDLAECLGAFAVQWDCNAVVLTRTGTLNDPQNRQRELAGVTCRWTFDPAGNVLRFALQVQPRWYVRLRAVRHVADLGESCRLNRLDRMTVLADGGTLQPDLPEVAAQGDDTEGLTRLTADAFDYLCLWEGRTIPGHAVGLHLATGAGSARAALLGRVAADGRLDRAELHQDVPLVTARQPLNLTIDAMLTTGGYYRCAEEYRTLMAAQARSGWCLDPSMSYDTGVELNAAATYLLFAQGALGGDPLTPGEVAHHRAWFDRHLALYLEHLRPDDPDLHERMFVRGLAFAMLAADTMDRAFPGSGYDAAAQRMLGALLRTEVAVAGKAGAAIFSNGPAQDTSRPELDSQCAALLALARMAFAPDADPALSAAIERGLQAIRVAVPRSAEYGNKPLDHETLVLAKHAREAKRIDTGFWNYKLGLALRAFTLIARGSDSGVIALSAAGRTHLDTLAQAARAALCRSVHRRGRRIEVLTSVDAGETNSETQPWAALGLAANIDELVLGLEPDAADWCLELPA